MKLFQYWDTGEPPDDVAICIETFRVMNPDMEYRLFSRDDAAWFIKKHHGSRELQAFEACAVPAMQSDYFRLCRLARGGGVYVDVDNRCVGSLSQLASLVQRSAVASWNAHLVNSFWVTHAAGDPFVMACLTLATQNIEDRAFNNVYTATGPGVLDAVRVVCHPEIYPKLARAMDNAMQRSWNFPGLVERARRQIPQTQALVDAFRAMRVFNPGQLDPWILYQAPAYKAGERHWLNWRRSLYQ